MLERLSLTGVALAAGLVALAVVPAGAAEDAEKPPRLSWSFSGPFGVYDRAQLQRGFKVYREVCSVCHSLKLVAFRNLAQKGGPEFTEAQAKTIAAEYQINDGPNDKGEMFERPGRLADYFPPPYPNDAVARATHNGALPPDLSVITKARSYESGVFAGILDIFRQYQEAGADYLHALLLGYTEPPPKEQLTPGQFWNRYFPGHRIAMRPPLQDGQVEYTDGSPQTVDQYSRDVTAFLAWAAEPHLETRKRVGFQVMIYLIVFAALLYFAKQKIWRDAH